MSTLKSISSYFSLVKFSHTLFALPFAMIGYTLAVKITGNYFDIKKLLLVLACMVTARSAAMAFNRYIDKEFDVKNPRTATREIPAGVISANSALFFVLISSALFVVATGFINSLCLYLSPVALLVILGYSYTKRFTALCHVVLGIGLSLAPIGAYLAVTGKFELLPLLFSFAVLFWVSGFDIIYALQDHSFDKSNKLFSIPTWLGLNKALMLSKLFHFITTFFIGYAGIYGSFGMVYWIGAAMFFGLLVYQHSLVKPHDLSKVTLAFATTNGVASILFATFTIVDLIISK
ncbi:MAG: UbiA-like polyprenyltransferase [Bacteroidota bacterium]